MIPDNFPKQKRLSLTHLFAQKKRNFLLLKSQNYTWWAKIKSRNFSPLKFPPSSNDINIRFPKREEKFPNSQFPPTFT